MEPRITLEHDRDWLVLVIERTKRTRRVYLTRSDAAYVHQLLGRELGTADRLRSVLWLRTFTGSCSGEGGKPRGFDP